MTMKELMPVPSAVMVVGTRKQGRKSREKWKRRVRNFAVLQELEAVDFVRIFASDNSE